MGMKEPMEACEAVFHKQRPCKYCCYIKGGVCKNVRNHLVMNKTSLLQVAKVNSVIIQSL